MRWLRTRTARQSFVVNSQSPHVLATAALGSAPLATSAHETPVKRVTNMVPGNAAWSWKRRSLRSGNARTLTRAPTVEHENPPTLFGRTFDSGVTKSLVAAQRWSHASPAQLKTRTGDDPTLFVDGLERGLCPGGHPNTVLRISRPGRIPEALAP